MKHEAERGRFNAEDPAGSAEQGDAAWYARSPKAPAEPVPEPNSSASVPDETNHGLRKRRRATLIVLGCAGLGVAAGLIALGVRSQDSRSNAAQNELTQRKERVPIVRIERVTASNEPHDVRLPAATIAFESATLYARQSGYISERKADIGTRVKSGDILAVISGPEVEDQLRQARAQLQQNEAALAQSEANRSLAEVTNQRQSSLVEQGWASKQQGDQNRLSLAAQQASVDVARANIIAQKAQISRLERVASYQRVTAPFDGVITQRNIDTGSLVTADQTSGTPLFTLARVDTLRVQTRAPQDIALRLKPGVKATLEVPGLPGRTFTGTITRTADALDAASRTLLVEVDIANPEGALTAGLFGTLRFSIPRAEPVIAIPSSALILNRSGLQVAVVEDGMARLKDVQLGDDNGATVQIVSGLSEGQSMIVAPPVDLADGAKVSAAALIPPLK